MIDLSDGLASDLAHILHESGGLGAVLDEAAIPIHDDAAVLARVDGTSALDHALSDGEDFELCLTVAEGELARLLAAPPYPARLYPIGRVTAAPGFWLRDSGGHERAIERSGFDHFRA
jgi:thiamine-monophosphate kinase